MLVDLILGAFAGPFRLLAIAILVALLGAAGALVWLRRSTRPGR
jgi:hypothetical protein